MLLEGSRGEFLVRERQMSNQYIELDKKYHKAKKLIKEHQQKYATPIGSADLMGSVTL